MPEGALVLFFFYFCHRPGITKVLHQVYSLFLCSKSAGTSELAQIGVFSASKLN